MLQIKCKELASGNFSYIFGYKKISQVNQNIDLPDHLYIYLFSVVFILNPRFVLYWLFYNLYLLIFFQFSGNPIALKNKSWFRLPVFFIYWLIIWFKDFFNSAKSSFASNIRKAITTENKSFFPEVSFFYVILYQGYQTCSYMKITFHYEHRRFYIR